ncbi:MAG: ATPase [Methylocystaceae bacterium]|nr:MAG: ATPase [Methylocystaceae bacterium]
MTDRSFTVTFIVDQTPDAVFKAVINVRGWWSEAIEGATDHAGGVFWYHFQDLHRCTMQVTELTPGRKVVWRVLDNYFSFTKDSREWTGTGITFDIAAKGDKTELRFTHHGLVPEEECYAACSDGWGTYITKSLRDLIVTGKGNPNVGAAVTETERALVG